MKTPPHKTRVCLLFGGKSGEHEVSLQSAKSIYEALDKDKYDVLLVGIDKSGKWLLGDASKYLLNATNPKLIALNKTNASVVTPVSSDGNTSLMRLEDKGQVGSIDVFFPITHGTYGEDGSLQGFLELFDVAYVGAGVLGSAVGMDKDVMKRLLRDAGIPVARYMALKKFEMSVKRLHDIAHDFGFPVFVKPANLGSSVGISKAHDENELQQAIKTAFQYDTKILIEEYVPGREIELSVLGDDGPIVSVPGEVLPQHEFYSYEAKYIDEKGAVLQIPAQLPQEIVFRLQNTAKQAFLALECSGMARVDFFVKEGGEIILNEINTLPGFTKISMYPKLWEVSGIAYSELLDRLIQLAQDRKRQKDILKRDFTI